jgi:hypothetical protein
VVIATAMVSASQSGLYNDSMSSSWLWSFMSDSPGSAG